MTTTTSCRRLCALALLAGAAGCSVAPRFERQFGQAEQTLMQQQILHPGAPASQSVAGLDGKAAKSAYDNYQKSYKDPVPQTGALAIGVGR